MIQDTILSEIVEKSLKFNEKGIYLFYMQINHICAWVSKTKMKVGFGAKSPFLVKKESLLDANYYINILQAAISRDNSYHCGSCFPVLKYSFSNVVVPDNEVISIEEGKTISEIKEKSLSHKHRVIRNALEALVVPKNAKLFTLRRRNSGTKVFSTLKLNADNL